MCPGFVRACWNISHTLLMVIYTRRESCCFPEIIFLARNFWPRTFLGTSCFPGIFWPSTLLLLLLFFFFLGIFSVLWEFLLSANFLTHSHLCRLSWFSSSQRLVTFPKRQWVCSLISAREWFHFVSCLPFSDSFSVLASWTGQYFHLMLRSIFIQPLPLCRTCWLSPLQSWWEKEWESALLKHILFLLHQKVISETPNISA